MFSFIMFVILLIVAVVLVLMAYTADRQEQGLKQILYGGSAVASVAAILALGVSMFYAVPQSSSGVVTVFGQVQPIVLPEGGHFVKPWQSVHPVFTGMDVASADKASASSKDVQAVHASLTANYHVNMANVVELYRLDPSLKYEDQFVRPALYDVFKGVMALYTAEELITKREQVSPLIVQHLNERLKPYYITVQTVNLVDFGFSKAFDDSIEQKVVASQRAQTAERDLVRIQFEAQSRVAQAKGEAEAISIQAAAVQQQGGAAYTQLKAIEKWDGKLPAYMTSGAATPFVSVGK